MATALPRAPHRGIAVAARLARSAQLCPDADGHRLARRARAFTLSAFGQAEGPGGTRGVEDARHLGREHGGRPGRAADHHGMVARARAHALRGRARRCLSAELEPAARSEERRVGKEWRSRWSPYQLT